MTDNLRGILLMTAAMAAFAVEDGLIKLVAGFGVPTGQITLVLGLFGLPAFLAWALMSGHRPWARAVMAPALAARCAGEIIGTFGIITGLALIPISVLSAILQAAPIVVTAGAALFLGERVGWRRWTAVLVGFAGVLLILRPTGEGFDLSVLWAVLGVCGLTLRDLATRRMPRAVTTPVVAVWGYAGVVLLGAAMLATTGEGLVLGGPGLGYLIAATLIGIGAYWAIIEATRAGDVAAITPFRYSRLLFALAIGLVVFDERLDPWMLTGTALVIASGLYTLYRERYHGIDSRQIPDPGPEARA
jgi:drug/metabolite transporter (DMT)-like permease